MGELPDDRPPRRVNGEGIHGRVEADSVKVGFLSDLVPTEQFIRRSAQEPVDGFLHTGEFLALQDVSEMKMPRQVEPVPLFICHRRSLVELLDQSFLWRNLVSEQPVGKQGGAKARHS